jgi:hypothetical protein
MLKIDQKLFSSNFGDNSYTKRMPLSDLVELCCFQKKFIVNLGKINMKNKIFVVFWCPFVVSGVVIERVGRPDPQRNPDFSGVAAQP